MTALATRFADAGAVVTSLDVTLGWPAIEMKQVMPVRGADVEVRVNDERVIGVQRLSLDGNMGELVLKVRSHGVQGVELPACGDVTLVLPEDDPVRLGRWSFGAFIRERDVVVVPMTLAPLGVETNP